MKILLLFHAFSGNVGQFPLVLTHPPLSFTLQHSRNYIDHKQAESVLLLEKCKRTDWSVGVTLLVNPWRI